VSEQKINDALKRAEDRIQRIMLDLEDDLCESRVRVDHVNVDTRNFANFRTEILTRSV
jgi:hypothetical protein